MRQDLMTANSDGANFGVVALLDLLGTKGSWLRGEPKAAIISWSELRGAIETITKEARRYAKIHFGDRTEADYQSFAFSDTMILSATGLKDEVLLKAVAEIVNSVMIVGLVAGLHIRGVISIGKYWQKDAFFIGPAIDEAADWYEECEWMGISATPSASFALDRLQAKGQKLDSWYVKYDIPTKHGLEKDAWATAWPKVNFNTERDGKTKKEDIRELLLTSFQRESISVAAYPKYKNTLAFYDFVNSRQRTS